MAAIERAVSSTSLLSYLNPLNLLKIPSYLYEIVSRILSVRSESPPDWGDRQVVVYQVLESKEDPALSVLVEGPSRYDNIFDYFCQATGPYFLKELTVLDLHEKPIKLQIPHYFLTDIHRCGEQDRFVLDGVELSPPPKSDEQKKALIEEMLKKANGDGGKVTDWTLLWNSRAKFVLITMIRREFQKQFGLDPSMSVNSHSVTSFNTATGDLMCSFSGFCVEGTDPDLNPKTFMKDEKAIKVSYQADFSYDATHKWVEEKISCAEVAL